MYPVVLMHTLGPLRRRHNLGDGHADNTTDFRRDRDIPADQIVFINTHATCRARSLLESIFFAGVPPFRIRLPGLSGDTLAAELLCGQTPLLGDRLPTQFHQAHGLAGQSGQTVIFPL